MREPDACVIFKHCKSAMCYLEWFGHSSGVVPSEQGMEPMGKLEASCTLGQTAILSYRH